MLTLFIEDVGAPRARRAVEWHDVRAAPVHGGDPWHPARVLVVFSLVQRV
ncbi:MULTISPECIES: radical SAM family protein [Gordonia]|nr:MULTISPECIES: hypothetical protein [Gordonia]MBD0022460.1 hypothetical protein [Gordonia sp. (in: high G+C Gram-positive bacteria)]